MFLVLTFFPLFLAQKELRIYGGREESPFRWPFAVRMLVKENNRSDCQLIFCYNEQYTVVLRTLFLYKSIL